MEMVHIKLHGRFMAYLGLFESNVLIHWNYRGNTSCDIVGRLDEEAHALAERMGTWIPDWFNDPHHTFSIRTASAIT